MTTTTAMTTQTTTSMKQSTMTTFTLPHDDCSVITLVHYYGDIRDGWRGVKGEWKGESGGRQAVEPLWGGRRKGEGSMDGDAREGKGGVTWVPKRSRRCV